MRTNLTSLILEIFSVAIVTILVLCMIGPVAAQSTQRNIITIGDQGSGNYYVGDIITFTGMNTFSNLTVIKITGPGISPQGVPPNNLTGTPGSGNTVAVNPSSGVWTFYWDTSTIQGGEMLQSARYYLTAMDNDYPNQSATLSILMGKSAISANIAPNPAHQGDYVQMTGNAANGISSINIAITDLSGNTLHSFAAPVSASGYFFFGFRIDMPPGQYMVVAANPLDLTQNLNTVLMVNAPVTQVPSGTMGTSSAVITGTEGIPAATTVPVIAAASRTTRAPLSPLVAIGGIAGAAFLFCRVIQKK
jgi:hypothetical protein